MAKLVIGKFKNTKNIKEKKKCKNLESNDLFNKLIKLKKKKHVKKIFNYKFIVPIIIILTGIIYSLEFNNNAIEYVNDNGIVVSKNSDTKDYAVAEYSKENINIFYPVTKYDELNQKIYSDIDKKVEEYEECKITGDFNFNNNFNIINIMINLSINLESVHPVQDVITINYNIKDDKIITIQDIIENDEILEKLSDISYKKLLETEEIKENKDIHYMTKNGTLPKIENFSNMIYKPDGLEIIFLPYKVAPYYLGDFKIFISFKELE